MTVTWTPTELTERPFGDLARFGDRPALVTDDGSLTYAELAERVAERAAAWQESRRLIVLTGANTVDFVVTYLAALTAGCPVVLVPGSAEENLAGVIATHDPDLVVRASAEGIVDDVRRDGGRYPMHPDLAVLLSTSGSTGSPKLVRLSHDNLASNAASIASYLALTEDDCGITSLPLHYCYGLSILNSHLSVGARIALTEASVVDDEFWSLVQTAGVTGLAGVPHTFDLLERTGFAERSLPTLRYVTQAGGRLAPERVRELHRFGRRHGWDFFVMYGQTEATARMAYLPPELAEKWPHAIGRAVPGGEFTLEMTDGLPEGVGELVYQGSNVMMGYAEHPRDLALAAMPPRLRTGDLARALPHGLFEVVGRRSRFTKVFGLRVNLDEVEAHLAANGVSGRCVGVEGSIDVFVTRRRDLATAGDLVAALCGVPTWVVRTHRLRELPMTPNGKTDYRRLAELADERPDSAPVGPMDAEDLRQLYARVLDRDDVTVDQSFADLGADSLSFVELAVRLGERVDPLPREWHRMPIAEIAGGATERRRWGVSVDTTVILRAVATLLIVGSHVELFDLTGGAHLLLILAGYNLARFHLAGGGGPSVGAPTSSRIGWALAAIALPSILWIGAMAALTGDYDLGTTAFLNWAFGSETWDERWRFWFLEALVWILLGTAVLFRFSWVRRAEAARPFAFALGVFAAAMAVRWVATGWTADDIDRYTPPVVIWCVALGWLAARATTLPRRILVSVIGLVAILDFFGEPSRERVVALGLVLTLWGPLVRLPRMLALGVGVLATSSLAVYLTHWQIYPHLEVNHPELALLASLVVGVAYHHATKPLVDLARRTRPGVNRSRPRTQGALDTHG
ncbi:acyl-CoA synthetase (AMP-forming)/AMP-acid ligase II [Nocardioides daedukensis]|uniref:Acyl-CoA synthetase (AMP-forming)/AMP-acid ligase II n=1 Tax=Nocardioides daedukensis TaxID=634462 RepID=A0A7Y9S460_9ACTN|nr:AMP-binding protein [Nocardioides daedukensis]NYG59688.1 acyl-CoA synthetase (AMP-forming)/AMP-acid ligase II [Nocardioides daedukensis]